ncbi:MAG: hypothetical protein JW955_11605 [Sedimentisphaerales bacterium]|nr:hypothetical protein [Sedimentisphaerales bacterium]
MITEAMIPMIVLPLTFLFVLLIILTVKAPKAGAWVIGSLVLVTPLALWRLVATGALAHEEAIPVIVLPATFLFVLVVILLSKAPKAGAAVVVGSIAMVVLILLLAPFASRHARSRPSGVEYAVRQTVGNEVVQVWKGDAATNEAVVKEWDRVFENRPHEPPAPAPISSTPSPIWSDGVEQEFKADIYSSKLAAVRAAGLQLAKSIRQLAPDANSLPRVVVYQETQEYSLVAELRDAIRRALPNVSCDIQAGEKGARPDNLGVMLAYSPADWQTHPAPWAKPGETGAISGQFYISLYAPSGNVRVPVRFTEKPWVESFATFASTRPDQHFIVARSNGTCTSDAEAHQQALNDAKGRIVDLLNKSTRHGPFVLPEPQVKITTTDILQGGFIVDQFAQSLEGSVGKIWRQAVLLDVSGSKLAKLLALKVHESRRMRTTWARMGLSVIGVTVLIGVIYFFLNMATRGYYEWSLRIAGIVLAIAAVVSILMVVR